MATEAKARIKDLITELLVLIGEDPSRKGLQGTPERVANMYSEIYRGYNQSAKPNITTFPNGEDGIVYDSMVVDTGDFYSCCEHHMMPFYGKYYFAYLPHPQGKILGISKIGRVVDYCAAKLQVQERLTHEVVDMLAEALAADCGDYAPLGIALVMRGEHLCKTMRGARKKGEMVSSCLTGLFQTDSAVRAEFFNVVNQLNNGKS